MSIAITLKSDSITAVLKQLQRVGRNKAPVLRAMGNTFKSITEGNFNSAGARFRPSAWPAKKDGTPSILQKNTDLVKAFHLEVTDELATLSNAKKYAAIHQFGGVIRPKRGKALVFESGGKVWKVKKVTMPARPFYPVANGKLTSEAERLIARAGERQVERMAGKKG